MQLPQIEKTDSSENYAAYRIEPLEPGWGHTLGSSLRRILLSSLLGAAVTAIRVEPLNDDMTGVEGIQDNLIDIILNVKQVRVKDTGDQFQGGMRLTLRPDGTGTRLLTAADLQVPEGIEVINPDTELLTPATAQG